MERIKEREIEGVISVITEAELLSAKRCQRTEEREKIASYERF